MAKKTKPEIDVRALEGKVQVTYPTVEVDRDSGYQFDTTRTMVLSADDAVRLAPALGAAAEVARKQSQKIKEDKRAELEAQLAALDE